MPCQDFFWDTPQYNTYVIIHKFLRIRCKSGVFLQIQRKSGILKIILSTSEYSERINANSWVFLTRPNLT